MSTDFTRKINNFFVTRYVIINFNKLINNNYYGKYELKTTILLLFVVLSLSLINTVQNINRFYKQFVHMQRF